MLVPRCGNLGLSSHKINDILVDAVRVRRIILGSSVAVSSSNDKRCQSKQTYFAGCDNVASKAIRAIGIEAIANSGVQLEVLLVGGTNQKGQRSSLPVLSFHPKLILLAKRAQRCAGRY